MEQTITNMIEFAFGDSAFTGIIETIGTILSNAEVKTQITEIFNNFMLPFGVYLMVIYFIKGLGSGLIGTDFTPEKIIKLFTKFIISYILVKLSLTIFWQIVDLGNAVTTDLTSLISVTGGGAASVATEMLALAVTETENFKLTKSIGFIFQLFIPWVVMLGLSLYIKFMVISREVEMLVRILWSPIAMSSAYEGDASGAVRYLKKFAALAIQMGVILSILYISSKITGSIISSMKTADGMSVTMIGESIKFITINLVTAGLIGKSVSFSEEIIGLR